MIYLLLIYIFFKKKCVDVTQRHVTLQISIKVSIRMWNKDWGPNWFTVDSLLVQLKLCELQSQFWNRVKI